MACAGCERRKAWIKKMMRMAYERTTGKSANRSNEQTGAGDGETNRGNKPPG